MQTCPIMGKWQEGEESEARKMYLTPDWNLGLLKKKILKVWQDRSAAGRAAEFQLCEDVESSLTSLQNTFCQVMASLVNRPSDVSNRTSPRNVITNGGCQVVASYEMSLQWSRYFCLQWQSPGNCHLQLWGKDNSIFNGGDQKNFDYSSKFKKNLLFDEYHQIPLNKCPK